MIQMSPLCAHTTYFTLNCDKRIRRNLLWLQQEQTAWLQFSHQMGSSDVPDGASLEGRSTAEGSESQMMRWSKSKTLCCFNVVVSTSIWHPALITAQNNPQIKCVFVLLSRTIINDSQATSLLIAIDSSHTNLLTSPSFPQTQWVKLSKVGMFLYSLMYII